MNYEDLLAEYLKLNELKKELQSHAKKLELENSELREKLKEAQWMIAQLRRELFGAKADKLTAEQEEQLDALNKDLEEEAQRPGPEINLLLEREDQAERRRKQHRRGRHPLPEHLETETVVLEPDEEICSCCGKRLKKIGEEVSEEIDIIPRKVIRRRTVRYKLA